MPRRAKLIKRPEITLDATLPVLHIQPGATAPRRAGLWLCRHRRRGNSPRGEETGSSAGTALTTISLSRRFIASCQRAEDHFVIRAY